MTTTTIPTLISEDDEKKHFYQQANQHLNTLNVKYREKAVITHDMSLKIIVCLQNKLTTKEVSSRFMFWCRKSFSLINIGLRCLLCDSKNKKPIITYEEMYDIYKRIHIESAHGGRDKCIDSLIVNYSWYNRDLLQIFIKNCSSCQKRKAILKPMLSKPIIALGEIYYYINYCFIM